MSPRRDFLSMGPERPSSFSQEVVGGIQKSIGKSGVKRPPECSAEMCFSESDYCHWATTGRVSSRDVALEVFQKSHSTTLDRVGCHTATTLQLSLI